MVEALRAVGKSVWWDDGLTPDRAWDARIEEEIAASKAVVVLWTPRSVQSDWVRTEAHYAQDRGKLIPVVLEPCELPLAFMLRQAIDLSAASYDASDPRWRKLLAWIGEASRDGGTAPRPLAEPTGRVAARRRPRWSLLAPGIALVVIFVGMGSVWLRPAWLPFAHARPDVVVDPFDVAASAGLPKSFASDMGDEMMTGFSNSSRIIPRPGDGQRRRGAYQLSGRVDTDHGVIRVYARIFAPGSDSPIVATRLEKPLASAAYAAREIGLELSDLVRCIATASDSSGSMTTTLPADAIGPWARFCTQANAPDINASAGAEEAVTTLRTVVAAAPDFANGWANLGEVLAVATASDAGDSQALAAEAAKAADRAIAIEPSTAKAYMTKAWLAVGELGQASTLR